MDQQPEQAVPCGRLLIQLQANPLALVVTTEEGNAYAHPLSPVAAQSLAYALLSQRGVGFEPSPETLRAVSATAEEFRRRDTEFLQQMGVQA